MQYSITLKTVCITSIIRPNMRHTLFFAYALIYPNEQYSLVHYGLYYSIGKRIASLLKPEITQSIRRYTYA